MSFTDDTILYIANLKDTTKKLLELVSGFSKVAGSGVFLYANNELTGKLRKQSHSQLLQKE